MLEMINQTTKDEPKYHKRKPDDFHTYQPNQFASKNTKSQVKLDNGNDDYGDYIPSQLQKKSAQASGLQLPNSIYNFDNVSY